MQAILKRLMDERMIRHFTIAGQIVLAGDRVRERVRQQVFGVRALPLRRYALAVAIARNGECSRCDPAPARAEHRCLQDCLRQYLARTVRMQVVRDFFERKTVRSEEHTSELQSLMRISYAVFCLKKKTKMM